MVTADDMGEVDRIAMETYNLGILQMMENAGRNLAENVWDMLGNKNGEVVILAGGGGNGGSGLCCTRHLGNHGYRVKVILDGPAGTLKGAAAEQWKILQTAGMKELPSSKTITALSQADLVVDALIGYSLRGTPRGRTAELISVCNRTATRILALDVPSDLNATTGEAPGVVIRAERILTLALPKTGLLHTKGAIYLADIGIPKEAYQSLNISLLRLFAESFWVRLYRAKP
jgi:NAD(P)H-hydrate epimerase